jgi:hypothetical protein
VVLGLEEQFTTYYSENLPFILCARLCDFCLVYFFLSFLLVLVFSFWEIRKTLVLLSLDSGTTTCVAPLFYRGHFY